MRSREYHVTSREDFWLVGGHHPVTLVWVLIRDAQWRHADVFWFIPTVVSVSLRCTQLVRMVLITSARREHQTVWKGWSRPWLCTKTVTRVRLHDILLYLLSALMLCTVDLFFLSLNGLVVLTVYVLLCTVQDCVNLPVDDVVPVLSSSSPPPPPPPSLSSSSSPRWWPQPCCPWRSLIISQHWEGSIARGEGGNC